MKVNVYLIWSTLNLLWLTIRHKCRYFSDNTEFTSVPKCLVKYLLRRWRQLTQWQLCVVATMEGKWQADKLKLELTAEGGGGADDEEMKI